MSKAKIPHVPPVSYDWAVDVVKLHRAEAYQKQNGLPTTEAAIKERYIALKGKVAGGIPSEEPKKAVKAAKPKVSTKAKSPKTAAKKPKAKK